MKAPSFWYQPRGRLSRALTPLGAIWKAGAALRRTMASPYKAKVPVICVGNIVAGGSGKTPTALALGRMLRDGGHKPVFVTRGYGGQEPGPLRVDTLVHTAFDVGDEALLLAQVAPTWIGCDRAAAIREAEQYGTHIILDDGLQNPSVRPDVSLLVIDAAVGLGNECLIPAGPLRETLDEALKRIQAVILIGEDDTTGMAARIHHPVLCARLEAALPENFPRHEKFLAFAGIGRPEKFYELCRHTGLNLMHTRDFPDHHLFSDAELAALQKQAAGLGARLLTTEKDAVRLPPVVRDQVLTLPVRLVFKEPDIAKEMLASAF